MKKILFFLLIFLNYAEGKSQSNFDYQKNWSTYFGSVGASPYFARGMGGNRSLLFDRENNIYLGAGISATPSHNELYYNQFQIGPNQNSIYIYPQGSTSNDVNVKFLSSGTLASYEYANKWSQPNAHGKFLVNIDSNGNKYYVFFNTTGYANSIIPAPTSGAWITGTNYDTGTTLAKYSSGGVLQWATYTRTIFGVQVDGEGNVYISGSNTNEPNFTTPGVFQQNFPANVSGYTGYIAKLNAQGQRLWVTYHPGFARVMRTYADGLYFTYDTIPFNNQIPVATSGAFQASTAKIAVMKLNAGNGTRDWGTFYGPASNFYNINGLEVNETGVYIMGTESASGTHYFATPGAHKPQVTGNSDYFLSKFNLNGNRIWSTYFGSNRFENNMSVTPMALSGDHIYVCGTISGDGNNIATAGAYQTVPEQNTPTSQNLFFSKFKTDGTLAWTSYYGGTSDYLQPQYLNIAYHNSSLYLYGNTNSTSGFTTPGCWQSQIVDPLANDNNNTNFLARFDADALSTLENEKETDQLLLYDNPNDGLFSISGKILEKERCSFTIYDSSGRKIVRHAMSRVHSQRFNLKNLQLKGNYILTVQDAKNKNIKSFKMIVH